MGHAKVENRTPYVFEALHLVDEEFRPLLVPLVKATFDIGKDGRCTLAPPERQVPANLAGEFWGDDPETSSYKYEPEVAFIKPATDVVLIGHAHAPRKDTTEMRVGLRVNLHSGALEKEAVVFGDRVWFRAAGIASATKPRPFEKIPLTYERAFGGWDRSHPDPTKHTFEPRNPVGTGFRGSGGFEEGLRLPNIEDPRHPIRSLGDRPPPTGFGFISPHWKPRAALAGTFDDAWTKNRAPLLPKDFDRRHLNAASPGLVAPRYLRGDESVVAVGVRPSGAALSFALPGVPPPSVRVVVVDGGDAKSLPMNLDTVIIEPDDGRVVLLWRGNVALRTGPHDVREIELSVEARPQ
jgi:hypothetical protein